jgi:hypothetical protein
MIASRDMLALPMSGRRKFRAVGDRGPADGIARFGVRWARRRNRDYRAVRASLRRRLSDRGVSGQRGDDEAR